MKKNVLGAIALAAVAAAATSASAVNYVWDWTNSGSQTNNTAGVFESIHAEYNNVSQTMIWNTTFASRNTDGYTLVVGQGPNPRGDAGQFGIVFFDARTIATPKITAYGYNASNAASSSWQDGNGAVAGNQTPDRIHANNNPLNWIQAATVANVGTNKRSFNLTIKTGGFASSVNSHTPLYPNGGATGGWEGMQFAQRLGLWFHTYTGLTTGYDANGFLNQWSATGEGYFDGANFNTSVAPLPTAAGLGLAGFAMMGRRQRRTAK